MVYNMKYTGLLLLIMLSFSGIACAQITSAKNEKNVNYYTMLKKKYECESSNNIHSKEYRAAIVWLLVYYHQNGQSAEFMELFPKAEKKLKEDGDLASDTYWTLLGYKLDLISEDDKDGYSECLDKFDKLTVKKFGKNSFARAGLLRASVFKYISFEDWNKLEEYVKKLKDVLRNNDLEFPNKEDSLYTWALLHLGEGICMSQDDIPQSEETILMAFNDYEMIGQPNSSFYFLIRNYYFNRNQFESSLEVLYRGMRAYEKASKDTTLEYYNLMVNVGTEEIGLGRVNEGRRTLEYVAEQALKKYGEKSTAYGQAISNLSRVIGHDNPELALKYARESERAAYKNPNVETNEYASTLLNLGFCMEDTVEARKYYLKAVEIIKKEYGGYSRYLISPYLFLMRSYMEDQEPFFYYLKEAQKLFDLYNLWGTIDGASCMMTLGHFLYERHREDASEAFNRAMTILYDLNLLNTERFANAVFWYTLSEISAGRYYEDLGIALIKTFFIQYNSNVHESPEVEREHALMKTNKAMYKDVVFTLRETDSSNADLYSFLAYSKGLLLRTSQEYAKKIYSTNDSNLINEYANLQSIKKIIAENKDADLKKINELKIESSLIERRLLTRFSRSEEPDWSSSQYEVIKSNLSKQDAVIEFAYYYDLKSDKKKYAALIGRRDFVVPKYVYLCEADSLDKIMSKGMDANTVDSTFGLLYNLLWRPLEGYLNTGDNVFFSPDGFIYQIPLENLLDAQGKVLNEKYGMYRCSSTNYVCNKHQEMVLSSSVLYGGLTYEENDDEMLKACKKYAPRVSPNYLALRGENDTRTGWTYIEKSLDEVKEICSIMRSSNLVSDTLLFTEADGNEESFKDLSGRNVNLLHLSTHGFFKTSDEAEKEVYYTRLNKMNDMSSISSMRRSGLILSGGSRAWLGQKIPEGVEDGVLTAEEISYLDLNSVNLLVLSACETGLGDIAADGVMGLQRAFKNAGVETIVMSLWKVQDDATKMLMTEFYRNLMNGYGTRESMKKAQYYVRNYKQYGKKIFENPYYWAGFIILD